MCYDDALYKFTFYFIIIIIIIIIVVIYSFIKMQYIK